MAIDVGEGYRLLLGDDVLVADDQWRFKYGGAKDILWSYVPSSFVGLKVDAAANGPIYRRKFAATIQIECPGPGHVEKLSEGRVVLSKVAWDKIRSAMVGVEYATHGPIRLPLGESDKLLLWLHAATEAAGYEMERLT